jgi:hypothetical protein
VTFPLCWCHQDFDVVYGLAALVITDLEQGMVLCLEVTMFINRPQQALEPTWAQAPRVQGQDSQVGHWFATT